MTVVHGRGRKVSPKHWAWNTTFQTIEKVKQFIQQCNRGNAVVYPEEKFMWLALIFLPTNPYRLPDLSLLV